MPQTTPILCCVAITVLSTAVARAEDPVLIERRTPAPVRSPYTVELIAQNGQTLATYEAGGRFYVLGTIGQRYSVRVENPTARRVEAVLSVDGLDVIDGKVADWAHKRGYVVPPWGELRVDGFRVSSDHVATFRFSSVASSYAGRTGKARNVGVIGVAIFEERDHAPPVLIEPGEHLYNHSRERAPSTGEDNASADETRGGGAKPRSAAPTARAPMPSQDRMASKSGSMKADGCCGAPPRERSGLGTEFGERRHSAVSWTRFERAHPKRPTAIAELRYNNHAGLVALGIDLDERVSPEETATRESANPFPDSPYATPPGNW